MTIKFIKRGATRDNIPFTFHQQKSTFEKIINAVIKNKHPVMLKHMSNKYPMTKLCQSWRMAAFIFKNFFGTSMLLTCAFITCFVLVKTIVQVSLTTVQSTSNMESNPRPQF